MPTLDLEQAARNNFGDIHIAGLDEAGRGALAGPVVAAAVILPLDSPRKLAALDSVDDSKRLTSGTRERLAEVIRDHALAIGIGASSPQFIDSEGIISATKNAMANAIAQLSLAPDFLLIDGRLRLINITLRQQSVIRGDSKSLSIAAASIIAKVHRDKFMVELDRDFPAYGFARHKGYGTLLHRRALGQLGGSPVHRFSFSPLRAKLLENP